MRELVERLFGELIDIDDNDCWNWTGSYKCNRPVGGQIPARNLVFKLEKGRDPEYFRSLRPKCKNFSCVNPYHSNEHWIMLQDTLHKQKAVEAKLGHRTGVRRAKAIIIPKPYPDAL